MNSTVSKGGFVGINGTLCKADGGRVTANGGGSVYTD